MNLLLAFFLHFIADFILQSREMGKNKSSNWKYLLAHLSIQFLVFLPFFGWQFSLANAAIHGIIDKNIWNLYKIFTLYRLGYFRAWKEGKLDNVTKYHKYWEDHLFYATIGLDQFLHSATLILLFNLGL